MDKELKQMTDDLNKLMDLFRKMEKSSLDDVDTLKEESKLLHKELKERYEEEDTSETDSQEA